MMQLGAASSPKAEREGGADEQPSSGASLLLTPFGWFLCRVNPRFPLTSAKKADLENVKRSFVTILNQYQKNYGCLQTCLHITFQKLIAFCLGYGQLSIRAHSGTRRMFIALSIKLITTFQQLGIGLGHKAHFFMRGLSFPWKWQLGATVSRNTLKTPGGRTMNSSMRGLTLSIT